MDGVEWWMALVVRMKANLTLLNDYVNCILESVSYQLASSIVWFQSSQFSYSLFLSVYVCSLMAMIFQAYIDLNKNHFNCMYFQIY